MTHLEIRSFNARGTAGCIIHLCGTPPRTRSTTPTNDICPSALSFRFSNLNNLPTTSTYKYRVTSLAPFLPLVLKLMISSFPQTRPELPLDFAMKAPCHIKGPLKWKKRTAAIGPILQRSALAPLCHANSLRRRSSSFTPCWSSLILPAGALPERGRANAWRNYRNERNFPIFWLFAHSASSRPNHRRRRLRRPLLINTSLLPAS